MKIVERKKELKNKALQVLVLASIQLIWIIPIGIKMNLDNKDIIPETETTSEYVSQTESETEIVVIETMEDDLVMLHIESETEIETETETEVEENTYYCKWLDRCFTEEEFALICTTTFCEAGDETSKGQKAVAITILNQIGSGKFGDTVHKVIYKKNNFSVTQLKDFENRGWTDKVEKSVLSALEYSPYPRDMYYFRTDHYHDWAVDYIKIGDIYFSTDK